MSSIKDSKKETNIQVVVRIRPPSEKEIIEGYPIWVTPKGSNQIVAITPHATTTRTFSFDKVFSQHDTQAMLYKEIVSPMIKEVLEGFNCTIFAYGQTGTGKTYTMEGDLTEITKDDIIIGKECGMIPRALEEFFNYLNKDGIEYSLRVSCIEIYNEQLKDLLTSDTSLKLQFYENPQKKVMVKNLEEIPVKNVYEAIQLFQKGMNERRVASTNYNERSSRSHCVYSITIHITENSHGQDLIKVGKLNLVDLAGSESIGRSGAENKQAREAGIINQSLLALGRVINSLVDKAQHIPYRESKLTRLLQDSLGGKTKTCVIATVAPTKYSIEESLSTLDYAFRAKNIRNKPEVNQHMTKKELIQDYMNEIKQLKNLLRCAREKDGVYLSNEDYNQLKFSSSVNDEENRRLKKLIDDQEKEILGLKHSVKDKSNEVQNLKNQIDENLEIILQKELDIQKVKQELMEEGVLLKSHMLSENNLNSILNDLNKILKSCSLELYKYHVFTDNKLSLERDNRIIFNNFRNCVVQLMKDLITRLEIIKSQHNDHDHYLFNSIQLFINEKIKNLRDMSENINIKMNEREEMIKKFNLLSIENIKRNEDTYQLMTDNNRKFINEHNVLFNNYMENINNEFHSFNDAFDNKSNTLNQYNESMKEIIINLKQDLSSFISTISSEMLSIKDNIIKQKNKEIDDLKKTIEFMNNQKSMELKKINEDKNVLLNNIKELIENFSDTHSKMFTETIEPATENLISMSNEMGSEIEIFNNKFSEIEDHINNNNNSLNDYVSSLELNNENHHKDNINFINESKSNHEEFNSLLNDNLNQMNNRINDFDQINNKSLQDLEFNLSDYKNNAENYYNTILSDFNNNKLFINENYNNDIKSFEDYMGTVVEKNNENEKIKEDNYNDYHIISKHLNDELIKSNTIFKINPLLNKSPTQNKYYNIYSWKTTPDHDDIINNYRELCKEKGSIGINNGENNNNNNEINNNKEINDNNNKIENNEENILSDKCLNDNENEIKIEEKEKTEIKTDKKEETEIKIDEKEETEIKTGEKEEAEIKTEEKEEIENINDFVVNDISVKKILYLSHNNIDFDYKEMRIEELENIENLFNADAYSEEELKLFNNNNTIDDNEYSIEKNEILDQTILLDENESNSSTNDSRAKSNDNVLLEDDTFSIDKNLVHEFESSEDRDLSEINRNGLLLEINDDNDEDLNDNDTVEIIVNEDTNSSLISDSDSSNEVKNQKKLLGTNKKMKRSIQKMDSAIELEEKINKGLFQMNTINDNDDNKLRGSLVTRKTFKNEKPLSGFTFVERKKPIRSASVPNTPSIKNKQKKSIRSKDDLSLKNMKTRLIKPRIEPF